MNRKCNRCYIVKPLSKFWKRSKDKHYAICGECMSEQQAEKRKNKPEMFLRKERKYEEKRAKLLQDGKMLHRREAIRLRSINRYVIRKIKEGLLHTINENTFFHNFGCSSRVFVQRFERYFKKNPGMTWQNHGAWHLDHIKPLKEFKLDTEANKKLANYYTNLRPEWATPNMKKAAKYTETSINAI